MSTPNLIEWGCKISISIGDALLKLGVDTGDFDRSMAGVGDRVASAMKKVQNQLRVAGAAFTGIGIAGLKMVADAKELNAQLGQTAITLDTTTKEARDTALALTDVTFPLAEVTKTMDLLARAGIRDIDLLKQTASAFDTLSDAVRSTASVVTDQMVMAMKTYGLTAQEIAAETDKVTYLVRNTALSMDDFASVVGYVTPELVKMGLTMDDTLALLGIMESKGVSGAVATRAFRSAITEATNEQIPLQQALGVTQGELDAYKNQMSDSVGMTQQFADEANKQFTLVDKLKQKWQEITLALSGVLEPLEPIFGLMSALGPVMLFLSTNVGIATVKWIAHTAAMVASKIAAIALNGSLIVLTATVAGLLAGLGMLAWGITSLIQRNQQYDDLIKATTKYNEAMADSHGKITEKVIESTTEYVKLREAYGYLTEEEQEIVKNLKNMLKLYDSGKLTLGAYTKALEPATAETLKLAGAKKKLAQQTQLAIDKEKEHMSLLGKLFPGGMTEEQWAQYLPLIEEMRGPQPTEQEIQGYFQGGGIMPQTGLAFLHKGERIIPANQMSASVVISGNNFYVRDESDIDRIGQAIVDKIKLRTGIR